MDGTKILVITATLGDRDTLSQTINSVKKIGKERVKHMIIAPNLECKKIKDKYPEIDVIAEPKDLKGIFPVLNYAILKYASEYKYFTFINDDDYWLPDFKKLFHIIENDPTVDVAYGKVNFIDINDNYISEQTSSPRYKSFKSLLSKKIILFTQQATLIKSSLFIKLGGFDKSYDLVADTDFWLKAIEDGAKFNYTKSICAAYRIQEGQLSSDNIKQDKEHERLINSLNFNPFLSYFDILHFRIYNISIYIKRILKNGSIKTMRNFFHK